MPYIRCARASALALAAVIVSVSLAAGGPADAEMLGFPAAESPKPHPSALAVPAPVEQPVEQTPVAAVPQMTQVPDIPTPPVPAVDRAGVRPSRAATPPTFREAAVLEQVEAMIAEAQERDREQAQVRRKEVAKAAKAAKDRKARAVQQRAARERARLAKLPWQKREGFVWPTTGWVTSHFGPRRAGFHHGVDIACKRGRQIRASKAGRVIMARSLPIYGKTIVIQHAGGYSTLYAHMQRLRVGAGRAVTTGQVIGNCGSTGRSTGPHLHFELRRNGKYLKPGHFLP